MSGPPRQNPAASLVLALAGACLPLGSAAGLCAAGANRAPNVVLILTDDKY